MEAVLFDLGDTLINFRQRSNKGMFAESARGAYDFISSKGIVLPAFPKFLNYCHRLVMKHYFWSRITRREFNTQDLMIICAQHYNLPFPPEVLKELTWMFYQASVADGSVEPGLHTMLAGLRSAGIKLGIVSNTFVPPHCLDRHLERVKLKEFFPVRIYSCEIGVRKPHPKIFRAALEKLGVSAANTVFVGDMYSFDVLGARRLGMKTVWKPKVGVTVPKKHLADAVVTSLLYLPVFLSKLGFDLKAEASPKVAAKK